MNLYAFELGRKNKLCLEELLEVLKDEKFVEKVFDIAIFETKDIDPQDLQDRLGGTIKIIKIFQVFPVKNNQIPPEQEILNSLQKFLEQSFKERHGKIPFSLCTYNFRHREIDSKKILNFSKKILKSLGLNSRFVNKDLRKNPKPSTIYKAKVIQKGTDFCLIKSEKSLYLGTSVTIQNIDDYSERDYEKPKRDARVGMLPPKLAQIMINLAGNPKTIYDPFCGTGTILMEAMLMGIPSIGSDIDERLVDYSKQNCEWLQNIFQTTTSFRVFQKDAQFIEKSLFPEKIDTIVTESYLGPPQTQAPSPEKQEKIFRELQNLHFNWLSKAKKILPKGAKIVMCVPFFREKDKLIRLPRFPQIAEENGFQLENNFYYDRPDQTVGREIIVLKLN